MGAAKMYRAWCSAVHPRSCSQKRNGSCAHRALGAHHTGSYRAERQGLLPRLEDAMPIAQAFSDAVAVTGNNASEARFALMLEVGGDISLQDAIRARSSELQDVAIFIGPEGGFTSEEQQAAQSCGIQIVKMGPRVMRAETAAIAAVTLSMAVLGEL